MVEGLSALVPKKDQDEYTSNSGSAFSNSLSFFRNEKLEDKNTAKNSKIETKYLSPASTKIFWDRFKELASEQNPNTPFTIDNFNKILLKLRDDKNLINSLRNQVPKDPAVVIEKKGGKEYLRLNIFKDTGQIDSSITEQYYNDSVKGISNFKNPLFSKLEVSNFNQGYFSLGVPKYNFKDYLDSVGFTVPQTKERSQPVGASTVAAINAKGVDLRIENNSETKGLNDDYKIKLTNFMGLFKKEFGFDLVLGTVEGSGFRPKGYQEGLYNRLKPQGKVVAKPGTSPHEFGRAKDFGYIANSKLQDIINNPAQRAKLENILKQSGLYLLNEIANNCAHVQDRPLKGRPPTQRIATVGKK